MYRLLAACHGGVRERRDRLTHPAYSKPELLAERPDELWSWDTDGPDSGGHVKLRLDDSQSLLGIRGDVRASKALRLRSR